MPRKEPRGLPWHNHYLRILRALLATECSRAMAGPEGRAGILAQAIVVQQFELPIQVVTEQGLGNHLLRCACFEGLDETRDAKAGTLSASLGALELSRFPGSTPGPLNLSSLVGPEKLGALGLKDLKEKVRGCGH